MINQEIKAIGIAWYRREDYPALLSIFTDASSLYRDYDSWLKKAEDLVNQITASGKRAIKAEINPNDFPGWCRDRGIDIDANARNRFANEFAFRTINLEINRT
ncbi:MAG: hypothetical protein HQL07_00620 [Nitrospirae bacterium]|nr:hypothetical protein [Magnetococcales bacterium]